MYKAASINAITSALDAVLAIPLDELERLMQQAHECDSRQQHEPPEPFTVSRQALRMLWHFRSNLDAVKVFMESK